ncbi:hypothetical protein PR048_011551 [Dryococelus australis]|uniref:Retrotransposon gag domain-containing protein n=1 Tax=Dryococelus australis TaxID=614101 RepID=A0ABQ9HMI5_9NEOP|nr:hypothetical protein PR048_011551 [Dryococelus australis]
MEKDCHLSQSDYEGKFLFNSGDSVGAENMAESHDLARALTRPQMAEWMHFVEKYENKLTQSIELFIETIENVASMLGWVDVEKLICCKMKLQGQAQKVLQVYSQMKDAFGMTVAFLYRNFKPHKSRANSFDRFFNCEKKGKEAVHEYTTHLTLAGQGTVADGPQREASVRVCVFEENLMAAFLKGQKPGIQCFVLCCSPLYFEKALQYREEEEQNKVLTNRKGYAQAVENREDRVQGKDRAPAATRRKRPNHRNLDMTGTALKDGKSVKNVEEMATKPQIVVYQNVNSGLFYREVERYPDWNVSDISNDKWITPKCSRDAELMDCTDAKLMSNVDRKDHLAARGGSNRITGR